MIHAKSCLLALFLGASDLTLIEEGDEGANILVVDELGARPPRHLEGLQGIRLLSVDVVGRTGLFELLPGEAGLITGLSEDWKDVTAVRLPFGRGALYHYSREDADELVYGYFHVDHFGRAARLLERSGTGAGSRTSPFLPKLAVDASGSTVLLATSEAGGGDLIEVELATRSVRVRTAGLPPLTLRTDGFTFLSGAGIGLADEGLVRFPRSTRAQATLAPFSSGVPGWIGADLAWSADRSTAVFAAGEGPDRAFLHAVRSSSSVRRLTHEPQPIERAGYLPDFREGPFLAVSTDGSAAAWLTRADVSRELWVMALPPPRLGTAAAAPLHVTHEDRFSSTLNDSGVIAFESPLRLVFAQGEGAATGTGPITRSDIYRAEVGVVAGRTQVVVHNLTASSSDTTVPFTEYGWLPMARDARLLPGRRRLLLFDAFHESLELLELDSGGHRHLLHHVRSVHRFASVGDRILLDVARGGPDRNELVHLGSSGTDLRSLGGRDKDAEIHGFALAARSFVAVLEVDDRYRFAVYDTLTDGRLEFDAGSYELGSALTYTGSGTVALSIEGKDDDWAHVAITPSGAVVPVRTSREDASILPVN